MSLAICIVRKRYVNGNDNDTTTATLYFDWIIYYVVRITLAMLGKDRLTTTTSAISMLLYVFAFGCSVQQHASDVCVHTCCDVCLLECGDGMRTESVRMFDGVYNVDKCWQDLTS